MADEQNDSMTEAKQSFFVKQKLIDSARTTFQLLSAVLKNVTFYPEEHPILLAAADKLLSKIEELLEGRKEAAFYLIGGELFFETLSVPIDQSFSLIMEQFAGKDIGGIIFKPGIASVEIIRFACMMSKESAFLTGKEDVNTLIAKEGIIHVTLHRALLVDKHQAGAASKEEKKKASDIYKDTIEALKEIVHAVQVGKAFNMNKVNSVIQIMVDNVLDDRDALMGLTNIKMHDEYTLAHSVNTEILSVSLGTYLSFDKSQLANLGVAALMHDIGKATIPNEIINKQENLTDEEWQQVQRHPIDGALLLANVSGVPQLAMVAAFEHHQYGEKGYPEVEGEYKRHPFSQIVSLADSYEAIASSRVYYADHISPDTAIRMLLKDRGVTCAPVLLQAFINMVGIFPIGTLLKLDTGEVGLVMHQTLDLMRPRVLILNKFDGSEKETGELVSLVETMGGNYKCSISGTIDPNIAKIDIKKYFD
jgi:HD-GYP domain-containing protein (c-di-GMP phosphodiesterase class II)